MNKIIKEILFIFKAFYIISSELIKYAIFRDYSVFIENLATRLASINILYVKMFQAIALNNSLIDEKTNNKLLKFTDNAPWSIDDISVKELIEFGYKYDVIFIDGYENPINSGMISIVFKAYKKLDKNPVIIKLKRYNIEEKLNDAIGNIQTFMYFLSFIPLIKKYQLTEVINKNIDIIRSQTNFNTEVQNMIKIKHNCRNLKYVKIPEVYEEITKNNQNIIMMEYIDGIKINQIDKEDYEGFAKQVMKFGFVTTIVHGVTHGDLHGGNILFIKDKDVKDEKYKYKIGVIDFGIIYELDSEYKGLLFDVLTQMFEADPRETSIKILNSGIIDPPGILEQIPKKHSENIINFTAEIIEETVKASKKANQIQIYKFLYKLKEYLSNSEISNIGIRPSDNFIKTQLVLAMSHGVTLTLCKDDFMALADKVINELFHTNMIM